MSGHAQTAEHCPALIENRPIGTKRGVYDAGQAKWL
jgi:hypothetical protein